MQPYPYAPLMGITRRVPKRDNAAELTVAFDPHLGLQRYTAVTSCIDNELGPNDLREITEFGAGNFRFFVQSLEGFDDIERVNLVDIDRSSITSGLLVIRNQQCNRTKNTRIRPLTAYVYHGNMAYKDHRVSNANIVIGIEVIEHLTAEDFEQFPENVFDFMQPKLVVFTTPNSDFNVLFDIPAGKFRHWDHKFEFSRRQFRDWAENVVERYPRYEFRVYGIGAPPPDIALDVGFASQMVVFKRKPNATTFANEIHPASSYELLEVVLVNAGDSRTPEKRELDKVANCIDRVLSELTYDSRYTIFMPCELCAETHWKDVIPVKMVQKFLQKSFDIWADVQTIIKAQCQRDDTSYGVEWTIALGAVFVIQSAAVTCDDVSLSQDRESSVSKQSSRFHAEPRQKCILPSVTRTAVDRTEIYHCMERFVNAVTAAPYDTINARREACEVGHRMSIVTPSMLVAHLQTNGIDDVDEHQVLKLWFECGENHKKYPMEKLTFGPVFIVENQCEGEPCKDRDMKSQRWNSDDDDE